jgi:hypothetical protein
MFTFSEWTDVDNLSPETFLVKNKIKETKEKNDAIEDEIFDVRENVERSCEEDCDVVENGRHQRNELCFDCLW